MKYQLLNNKPLQFYNTSGELIGTIEISSSGDMLIRPDSGSSRDIILGNQDTVGDIEVGQPSAETTWKFIGGGMISANGNTLTIGDSTAGDIVIIDASVFSGSFSGSFQGDGSQLTGIESSSYATTASYALTALSASYAPGGGGGSTFPFTGDAEITGSLVLSGSNIDLNVLGDITASGDISSSGTITAITGSFSYIQGNSPIKIDGKDSSISLHHVDGVDNSTFIVDDNSVKLSINDNATYIDLSDSGVSVKGEFHTAPLTASVDISSSGTITALSGSFSELSGNSPITLNGIVNFSQELNVSGSAGVLLENNGGDKFEIKCRYDDGESPVSEQPIFSVLNPGVNSTNIVLGQTGSGGQTSFFNNIQTLNLWPEWSDGALIFGTSDQDGGGFDSASIQFGNIAPTSPTGPGVDLGTDLRRLRNVYAFNFTGSGIDVDSITSGHITSSGNISSSGDIYGTTGSFGSMVLTAPNGTKYLFSTNNSGHLQLTGSVVL